MGAGAVAPYLLHQAEDLRGEHEQKGMDARVHHCQLFAGQTSVMATTLVAAHGCQGGAESREYDTMIHCRYVGASAVSLRAESLHERALKS